MEFIWIILRRDLKSLFTLRGKGSLREKLGLMAGAVVWFGLGAVLNYGALKMFQFLAGSLSVVPELRRAVEINVLNGSSLFVLVMVLLMGIQTTYKTVYESADVGFLLSQPVPVWTVFGAKFVVSFATTLVLSILYGLPVWIAFGSVRGLGSGFYFLAAAGFVTLLLAAHAVLNLLLMAAMKHLPGRKMKQMFIAFSAVFGVLIVLMSQLLSSRMSRAGDPVAMIEELGKGQLSRMWYLPSTWMTNGILGSVAEFGIDGTKGWVALLLLAAGATYAALTLSTRWYLSGWSGRAEELVPAKRKRRRAARVTGNRLQGVYWSVLRKDLKTLWRDPVVWYTVVVGVIGLAFFAYNMMGAVSQGSEGTPGAMDGAGAFLPSSIMIAMPALMGAVTSSQTGGVSLSREGKSFWILRAGPVNARSLVLAKFTYAILPPLAFVSAFSVFLEFTGLPHLSLWLALPIGFISSAILASLQILLDVYYPDFELKIELGAGVGGRGTGKVLITMFSSMAMVFLIALVLLSPVLLESRLGEGAGPAVTYVSYLVLILLAFGMTCALLGPGTRRLSRMLADM
jgi:ABC-2 type transport system permease protein